MKIGQIIAQYREEHGLSQRDFAARAGLSSAVISFIEKGERDNGKPYIPKIETIQRIARVMGVKAESLLHSDDFNGVDVVVGPDETPIMESLIRDMEMHRTSDEEMLVQVYRMIPIEHRFEAMHAVLNIKDKYKGE